MVKLFEELCFEWAFGFQEKELKVLVPSKGKSRKEKDRIVRREGIFTQDNSLPVRQLFPGSIFPHVLSEGSEVWRGRDRCGCCEKCDWCDWCVSVCCRAQWPIRARSPAESAAAPSEPLPWWPVSVQAGHELLGGSGPRPLEGAECGHSPGKDGEILEEDRPTVKRIVQKVAVADSELSTSTGAINIKNVPHKTCSVWDIRCHPEQTYTAGFMTKLLSRTIQQSNYNKVFQINWF